MKDCRQFYIDGKWVIPTKAHDFNVINPANEQPIATISLGTAADVDKAVAAARKAFEPYSETSVDTRLALLQRIIANVALTSRASSGRAGAFPGNRQSAQAIQV